MTQVWTAQAGVLKRRGHSDTGRPTGPGYVRYEDVYVSGDTLQQTIDRVTGNRVLTFPEGEFTFSDFAQGYFEGIRIAHPDWGNGCRGLAGSGPGTVFKMVPNSSTKQTEGNKTTGTNACTLITATALETDIRSDIEFRNFSLIGTEQGHYYNGLKVAYCEDAIIDNLYLKGAAPGWAGVPPGETFGISVFRSPRTTLSNCEIDGRHPDTNEPICASPFGWNSTTDAIVNNVYCHDSGWGMPTFWDTITIHTTDLRSEYHASGAPKLNGVGVNHENVGGEIRHVRPKIICNSRTGNVGMHMTLQNGVADATDVQIIEPTFDPGHTAGCFSIMISDNYIDPQGRTQKQVTMPTVIKNGITLTPRDANMGDAGATPDNAWFRFH